jgi:hypothetical protein
MRKLYGPDLRKDAGLTKTIKKVTRTQAKLLRQRAPELDRVVQEVRGTFDKVYADTAHIVEEFLAKCACYLLLCGNEVLICGGDMQQNLALKVLCKTAKFYYSKLGRDL